MRPVDKGHKRKEYKPYKTAKRDLFDAIGPYCSYCERRVEIGGAVEHVQPKSMEGGKQYDWDNFLLGCVNCNSTKGDKDINDRNLAEYVWPDVDDTYHMIKYDPDTLMPYPSPDISTEDQERVARLIALVGLNVPSPKEGSQKYKAASDTRVEDRIKIAVEARNFIAEYKNLQDEAKPLFINVLMSLVKFSGNWSIWMSEFEDIPEIKEAFLNLIPGTKKSYFF